MIGLPPTATFAATCGKRVPCNAWSPARPGSSARTSASACWPTATRSSGIDCFTDYYPRPIKERNLAAFRDHRHFTFHELDLSARRAGGSWSTGPSGSSTSPRWPGLTRSWLDFDLYNRHNLTATHRLLEAAEGLADAQAPDLRQHVVGVRQVRAAATKSLPTRPSSPYGITKLAAEQLCRVYGDEFGVPAVVLRYFSVYGPRQRPEMGYHLFIDAILQGKPITLTGDGLQVRGNTYVADCVDATVRATQAMPGETFNLGGGELVTVLEVSASWSGSSAKPAIIERHPPRKGDQLATGADVTKLSRHLGWKPTTGIDEGLAKQVEWQRSLMTTRRAANNAIAADDEIIEEEIRRD